MQFIFVKIFLAGMQFQQVEEMCSKFTFVKYNIDSWGIAIRIASNCMSYVILIVVVIVLM